MKYILLSFLLLLSSFLCFASNKSVKIVYHNVNNGKIDSSSYTILEISQNVAKIYSVGSSMYGIPKITTYISFIDSITHRTATLDNGEIITSRSKFKYENEWQYLDDIEEIAGVKCKKAKVIINSNTIEVYYSPDDIFLGTPSPRYGVTKGIVLKVCINGSRIIQATDISYSSNKLQLLPDNFGNIISSSEFERKMNENSTITVDVFDNQHICFDTSISSPKSYNELTNDIVYRFANGTLVLKKVALPDSAWNYNVFAELSQYSDGDAYDRSGSVFVIPTNNKISFLDGLLKGVDSLPYFIDGHGKKQHGKISTKDYTVPVELMRFFTSFGVRKYNHYSYGNYQWLDSVMYIQDITQYSSLLSKEAWIGVFIGNYDKNGHVIDLKLKYHPYGQGNKKNLLPLFCTLNLMEMSGQEYSDFFDTDTLSVDSTTDSTLTNVTLNYVSTGHGGWDAGDEFNRRPNTVMLDNFKTVYTPWRNDCACHREKNPCSGNFPDGLSSSDYSRSGWCPGTITDPVELFYNELPGRRHSVRIAIPQGLREGDSTNAWNVSGVLVW